MARRIDPRAEPTSDPPEPAKAPEPVPAATPAPKPPVVTSADPRVAMVEEALGTGDWKKITRELGSLESAGQLPPNLGLINAIAHLEATPADAAGAHALAIRCMAAIFAVAPESRLAIVFAKRLTRRNPVSFRERPAPPARTSLLIVVVTFVVVLGVAWLLTSGAVRLTIRHG